MNDVELNKHLALCIAKVLCETHIEGWYDSVSCSTAGDYPSIGVSQWEGYRCNELLKNIPGGNKFINRTYSDIVSSNQLEELKLILSSEKGKEAQINLLSSDTLEYVKMLRPLFTDSKCLIMAGSWCPTSSYVVKVFLQNRISWGYNINNLETLRDLFAEQYYKAADVGNAYKQGYYNRAINVYNWIVSNSIW